MLLKQCIRLYAFELTIIQDQKDDSTNNFLHAVYEKLMWWKIKYSSLKNIVDHMAIQNRTKEGKQIPQLKRLIAMASHGGRGEQRAHSSKLGNCFLCEDKFTAGGSSQVVGSTGSQRQYLGGPQDKIPSYFSNHAGVRGLLSSCICCQYITVIFILVELRMLMLTMYNNASPSLHILRCMYVCIKTHPIVTRDGRRLRS